MESRARIWAHRSCTLWDRFNTHTWAWVCVCGTRPATVDISQTQIVWIIRYVMAIGRVCHSQRLFLSLSIVCRMLWCSCVLCMCVRERSHAWVMAQARVFPFPLRPSNSSAPAMSPFAIMQHRPQKVSVCVHHKKQLTHAPLHKKAKSHMPHMPHLLYAHATCVCMHCCSCSFSQHTQCITIAHLIETNRKYNIWQ